MLKLELDVAEARLLQDVLRAAQLADPRVGLPANRADLGRLLAKVDELKPRHLPKPVAAKMAQPTPWDHRDAGLRAQR